MLEASYGKIRKNFFAKECSMTGPERRRQKKNMRRILQRSVRLQNRIFQSLSSDCRTQKIPENFGLTK